MGNGMNKILPGLYIGNFKGSEDRVLQMERSQGAGPPWSPVTLQPMSQMVTQPGRERPARMRLTHQLVPGTRWVRQRQALLASPPPREMGTMYLLWAVVRRGQMCGRHWSASVSVGARDARDAEQLSRNKVTHILSVHDSARPMLEGVKYLCIPAADSPSQNLTRHFRESIKFIHECRLGGEGCLVHCLAGVSRSVTLVVAYIMTVTDFGWEDALHTVRAGRSCANPNLGFQRQLQEFEKHQVHQFRQWLREEYGENPLRDAEAARSILAVLSPHGEQPHVRPLPLSSCAPPCRLPLAARASLRGLHAPRSWKKERFWAPSRFPLEYAFKSP
ncbi:dual specificity protein phosphatase 22 isoform X4 [Camelus dromedarius]|uniref:dual specificity protein phosphatase 22 isoform X4 n=1 Tax=Camelus dromedarius TaxID=9838 RepID=UPI003119C869